MIDLQQMEDTLALGLVAGGLFIVILMVYNRGTHGGKRQAEKGGAVLRYGLFAGVAAVAAKYMLSAKFRPPVTVFRQDPPF